MDRKQLYFLLIIPIFLGIFHFLFFYGSKVHLTALIMLIALGWVIWYQTKEILS